MCGLFIQRDSRRIRFLDRSSHATGSAPHPARDGFLIRPVQDNQNGSMMRLCHNAALWVDRSTQGVVSESNVRCGGVTIPLTAFAYCPEVAEAY